MFAHCLFPTNFSSYFCFLSNAKNSWNKTIQHLPLFPKRSTMIYRGNTPQKDYDETCQHVSSQDL